MEKSIKVTEGGKNVRADVFVSENEEDISRSFAGRLFSEGLAKVNGRAAKPSLKLKEGDVITFTLPEPEAIDAVPEDIPLDIVYEDDSVLVINKPRGMVVHPAVGNERGTVVNAALFHCQGSLSGINGSVRPGIVHRIDKDTTGLLVIAKNDRAHKSLTDQLADRSLSRVYYALVNGNIKEDSGTVDAPIGRSPKDRKKMAVVPDGRSAVTDFEVIERFGAYTLVRCKLRTGRTHQIRVHMKHIGHSVVGDKAYGNKNERFALAGQLLHAKEISFIHPETGEKVTFSCPLPEDFSAVLEVLRKTKKED